MPQSPCDYSRLAESSRPHTHTLLWDVFNVGSFKGGKGCHRAHVIIVD